MTWCKRAVGSPWLYIIWAHDFRELSRVSVLHRGGRERDDPKPSIDGSHCVDETNPS